MQAQPSLLGPGTPSVAGFPAAMPPPVGMPPMPYAWPHPYYSGGVPPPPTAMPMSPYPYFGAYGMPAQAFPPPSHGSSLAAPSPLLRQLFGAAIAGPRVGTFNPPARGAEAQSRAGGA